MGWAARGALAALGLVAVSSATPGRGLAQTLEEALVQAYTTNPQLLAQRARVRSVDEQVPQALSNWRPTVEFTGEAGTEYSNLSTRATDTRRRNTDPRSVQMSLTQPLFRGGRTLATTSRAENAVKAERGRLLLTEQQVFFAVVTAYLDVFRDEAVLELNRNNEQVLRRQLEAAQDRFQVGEITRTDVHQAEARLARSVADRIQGEGNLEASRAAFQNVVGEPPRGRLSLPPQPEDQPESEDAAVRVAVTDNPDVITALFDYRSNLDNVDAVWGELLPTLQVEATASREIDSSSTIDARQTQGELKLSLSVPIYEKGLVYARVREAKQNAARFREQVDQKRRDAQQQAIRSWEAVQTARARVEAFRTQIRAAEIAFEGVEREAAVGSRTVLDVLDAEQELLDARVNFVRAQRDEIVAVFDLRSAMGRLTARQLKLPVVYYDPEVHYNEVKYKFFGTSSPGGSE
jgi:outer membrane protein